MNRSDRIGLADVGSPGIPPGQRANLCIDMAANPDGLHKVTMAAPDTGIDMWLDTPQLNFLHEQLGRILVEAGVTMRAGALDTDAIRQLREARKLLHESFLALAEHVPNVQAVRIARYLFANDA